MICMWMWINECEHEWINVKNALKDYCGLQVTCKGLADYMNCEYGTIKYKGNSIKGFRMSYDDFKRFLNGGEVT